MRAILVSVTYTDILRLTLPWNRHHFSSVLIVTSLEDYTNVLPVALANSAEVFGTDVFYQNGAKFNKWAALNEGLEYGGFYDCHDYVAVLDADTCWPRDLEFKSEQHGLLSMTYKGRWSQWSHHHLLSPLRRMYPGIPKEIPDESGWSKYPHHRYQAEFSGYTMLMHSDCEYLKARPWFSNNWSHCGGGDSDLERRWPKSHKIRPSFDVLHLGESAANWMGRTSRLADGSLPPNHETHQSNIQKLWQSRRHRRGYENSIEKLL